MFISGSWLCVTLLCFIHFLQLRKCIRYYLGKLLHNLVHLESFQGRHVLNEVTLHVFLCLLVSLNSELLTVSCSSFRVDTHKLPRPEQNVNTFFEYFITFCAFFYILSTICLFFYHVFFTLRAFFTIFTPHANRFKPSAPPLHMAVGAGKLDSPLLRGRVFESRIWMYKAETLSSG